MLLTSTTFEIPGHHTVKSLGIVRRLGANAVIGVRYDTGPMIGAAEVLGYGTAVVVERAAP